MYQLADTFFVRLIVNNTIGCVDTAIKPVKIAALPVAAFTDQNACEGYFYSPLDSSKWFNDIITQWRWEIADSVYDIQSPQHYFAAAGTYPAELKVTTQSGCTDLIQRVVTIYTNPTASFSFSPFYGEAPLDVVFNNLSTNAITYEWDFGDNSISYEKNPTHTYPQNGNYTIWLTAISDKGCTDSFSQTFSVSPTELDLSVDKVDATPSTQSDGSVLITVTVSITNIGTRIITSAKLYAILGSGGLITEDLTDTLIQPGDKMDYVFHAQFVATGERANSYVCVEAKDVNGGAPEIELRYDNNKQCVSLSGGIQLVGPLPNPASDKAVLGIILPKAGKVNIAIANVAGQYVLDETEVSLPAGRSDFEIPVYRMSAAEYFIRVTYNDDKFVRKFVLKK